MFPGDNHLGPLTRTAVPSQQREPGQPRGPPASTALPRELGGCGPAWPAVHTALVQRAGGLSKAPSHVTRRLPTLRAWVVWAAFCGTSPLGAGVGNGQLPAPAALPVGWPGTSFSWSSPRHSPCRRIPTGARSLPAA